MLALKYVSGLLVIERLDVPLNEREIFTVMFRVAARALPAGAGRNVISRMQSLMRAHSTRDFIVAVKAFERRLAAELVATGAVRRSIERSMRFRQ